MFEQVIVLVLVGLFALGKWLLENAGKSGAGKDGDGSPRERRGSIPGVDPFPRQSRPRRPIPQASAESEEERMRRFMEALGLPPNSAPPARPQPPSRPARPQPPAPASRPVRAPIAPPSRLEPIAPPAPLPKAPSVKVAAPPMEVSTVRKVEFASPQSYIAPASPLEKRPIAAAAEKLGAMAEARVQNGGATVRKPSSPRNPLLAQLRGAAALRNAIVLREILGPPKAFSE